MMLLLGFIACCYHPAVGQVRQSSSWHTTDESQSCSQAEDNLEFLLLRGYVRWRSSTAQAQSNCLTTSHATPALKHNEMKQLCKISAAAAADGGAVVKMMPQDVFFFFKSHKWSCWTKTKPQAKQRNLRFEDVLRTRRSATNKHKLPPSHTLPSQPAKSENGDDFLKMLFFSFGVFPLSLSSSQYTIYATPQSFCRTL